MLTPRRFIHRYNPAMDMARRLPANNYGRAALYAAGAIAPYFMAGNRSKAPAKSVGPKAVVSAPVKLTKRQQNALNKRVGAKAPPARSLKKQFRELKKTVEAANGTLIYRTRRTGRALAAVNQQTMVNTEGMAIANFEGVLAQLKFFNPAVPGTLTTASGATGTYARDYQFKSIHTNLLIRNNYQVPVKVTCYTCVCKDDTTITPTTAFTDGLTDAGNPSSSSPLVYLTDSEEFNDLWKIESSKSKVLMPGVQFHVSKSIKDIMYSPAVADSHALDYQRRLHSYVLVVRIEGMLGHDSSADQQGFVQAGVDLAWDTTYKVIYNAGADIFTIYVDDGSDSFTNGGLVSSMPVADNIGYSVS